MPAMLCLLVIAISLIAALSLDLDGFVTLLLLFCIVAGLSSTSTAAPRHNSAGDDPAGAPSCRSGAGRPELSRF